MAKKDGKKRPPKLELVFNEKDRRDYLTGFKKRKQERRETAAKKFEKRFQQEKNRIRLEKRTKRVSHGPTVLPDNMLISEEAEQPVTQELEQHTVSVAHISDLDLTAGGLFLGKNTLPAAPPEEEEEQQQPKGAEEDEVLGMELKATPAAKTVDQPVSQRSRQNILQTKARLEQKKNKKKSQHLQKHKARVRKNHMKLNHQLKRQRQKGSAT